MFKSLSSAIKEAVFGKSLLVYLKTIRQVAKIDQEQGQIQFQILVRSSSARTFFLLLTFLVGNSSSVSFFSALWLRTVLEICRFLLVIVLQAMLAGLTETIVIVVVIFQCSCFQCEI